MLRRLHMALMFFSMGLIYTVNKSVSKEWLDGQDKRIDSVNKSVSNEWFDNQKNGVESLQVKDSHTVVTAYFRVPSKHAFKKYLECIPKMLSLQDNMVIFTFPEFASQIQKFRSHALNRTLIISINLEDVPVAKKYSKEYWQRELDRDPEKKIHRSYQLFWIFRSKPWFVSEAIRVNPFDSKIFVWADIGGFRGDDFNNKTFVMHPELISRNSFLQNAHLEHPQAPNTVWWNYKKGDRTHFFQGGGFLAGYKETWEIYYKHFMDTLQGFVDRDMFVGDDQAVMQSTCLQHPDLCDYITYDQYKEHAKRYFGLRYALHFGGNYTMWRPYVMNNTAADGKRNVK